MYITKKSLWEIHKNRSMIARFTGHDFKDRSQKDKRNIRRKRISHQEAPPPDIRLLRGTDHKMVKRQSLWSKDIGNYRGQIFILDK